MKRRIFITTIVIVCTVVITSFSIDAADTLRGRSGTLLSNALSSQKDLCPTGMVHLSGTTFSCVDAYEDSPSPSCAAQRTTNTLDTRSNMDDTHCIPQSAPEAQPWVFVAYHQAVELCARAGKRLPTNNEWYKFSAGTPDSDACTINQSALSTPHVDGQCINAFGVHDAIGNAWEWIDAVVKDGVYDGHAVPDSGYVTATDDHGVATLTSQTNADPSFHEDYFWSEKSGEFGMLRGGFYGSGKDGGLYSIQAKTPLSFSSGAVGFRCVKDI
jgi:formylglycine-generating enzyme required for sulfatase activity